MLECYKWNRPDEIYHVTVMPCYDKKLEASRDDFVFQVDSQAKTNDNEALMITEVDSVLTSGEVLELVQVCSLCHNSNYFYGDSFLFYLMTLT